MPTEPSATEIARHCPPPDPRLCIMRGFTNVKVEAESVLEDSIESKVQMCAAKPSQARPG